MIKIINFVNFQSVSVFRSHIKLMAIKALITVSFVIFSFVIALGDIKTQSVPRAAFVIAIPVFLALKLLPRSQYTLFDSLAGLLAGLLAFLLAFFVSGGKLGLADVWYSALAGLVLGPGNWYAAMGFACAAGMVFLLVSGRRSIAFIPFMALGSVIMIFFDFV